MSDGNDGVFRSDVTRWVLMTGNRALVTAGILGVAFLVTFGLTWVGGVRTGPRSTIPTIFGSGFIAGILAVVTVSLSINQLVLSRVFGTPGDLLDELDDTLAFRRRAEDRARRFVSPDEPSHFLRFVEETIRERTDELRQCVDRGDCGEDFGQYLDELDDYCDYLRDASNGDEMMEVVARILGTQYATKLRQTSRRLDECGDELPSEATDDLETVFDSLKQVAVLRQFFKTVAIQRDLALLSRRVGVLGLLALVVSAYTATMFEHTLSVVPGWTVPAIVSGAFAVAISPVAMLISHVVRVATVSLHTVSVGPFVPPSESDLDWP